MLPQVLRQADRLTGQEAVLAAAGDNPYTRMTTTGRTVRGYRSDGAVVWIGEGPWGPVACAVGQGAAAVRLFAAIADRGWLDDVRWLHLPRVVTAELAPYLRTRRQDDWDFRWTVTAPPRQPGEDRVVPLGDRDPAEIAALLDQAYPGSTTRPRDPRVGTWYGIHEAARLVACGADRSQGDVAFLAGLAVAGDRQGRGLGTTLTAAMTRRMFARYDVVALGVMTDNVRAGRLYHRLGFTSALPRSSVAIG